MNADSEGLDEAKPSGHPMHAHAGNHLGSRTGAHMGVGQMSTGQYESLVGEAAIEFVSSEPSAVPRSNPVVSIEPLERRPPPRTRPTWLPWAIVGAAIVLVLVGVMAVALL